MSHWTSQIQDRWLWLGLGAITIFAIPVVAHGLRSILHLTAVTPDVDEPLSVVDISVSQSKEDAINLDTIKVLTRCPNHEIRSSAMKMLLVRTCKDTTTLISLHRDLSSTDTDIRSKAQLSHDLLKQHLMQCPFERLRVWRIHALNNKNSNSNKKADIAGNADTADGNANADPANTAVLDTDTDTDTGINLLQPTQKAEKLGDTCPICSYAFSSISINGFIDNHDNPSHYRERNTGADGDSFGSNNLIMSIPLDTSPRERRERMHAESPEEIALRRRRREAIVLNDGNRPVAQEDIIQRGIGGVRVSTNEMERG